MASRHALLHPNSIYQSNRDGVYANACVYTGCFFHASQFPLPIVCVCAHMCVCAGVNVCVQSLLQWGEIRCPQYARAPESQTITQIQISKKTKQKSCNILERATQLKKNECSRMFSRSQAESKPGSNGWALRVTPGCNSRQGAPTRRFNRTYIVIL